MPEHLKTRLFTAEEAKLNFDAFSAEVDEMARRYGFHGAIAVVTASVPSPDPINEPDALGSGLVFGCQPHAFNFLAMFLVFHLDPANFTGFLALLHKYTALKIEKGRQSEIAGQPAEASSDNLLMMPIPGGKTWQN